MTTSNTSSASLLKFTFNNKEYELNEISDKAKAIISLLQRNQEQLDMYNISYTALTNALQAELAETDSADAASA